MLQVNLKNQLFSTTFLVAVTDKSFPCTLREFQRIVNKSEHSD